LLWAQRVIAKKGAPACQLLDIKPDANFEEAQAAFHKIARLAHPDLHRNSLAPEDLEVITTAYSRIAAAYQEIRNSQLQTLRMRPLQPDPPPPRSITQPPPLSARPVTQPPPLSARPMTQPPPLSGRPLTQPPPLSRPITGPLSRPITGPLSRPSTGPLSRPATGPLSRPVTQPPPLDPNAPPLPVAAIFTSPSAAPAASADPPSSPQPPLSAGAAMSSKALVHYRKAELCLRRGDLKGAVLQLKMAIACDPQSSFLRTALAEVEAEVST
jgi:hypothetical protein